MKKLFLALFALSSLAYGAGTISYTKSTYNDAEIRQGRRPLGNLYTITFTADASDGSVPTLSIPDVYGYLEKGVFKNGGTAPTNLWDVKVGSSLDSALDEALTQFNDRSNAASTIVYPVGSGAPNPPLLQGTLTIAVTGNLVNSATATIYMYVRSVWPQQ